MQSSSEPSAKTLELVLYKTDFCPFCIRVMDFIKQRGLTLEYKDIIADETARQELLHRGGKTQVPCLFVNGKPMYESGDIIAFLARECVNSGG